MRINRKNGLACITFLFKEIIDDFSFTLLPVNSQIYYVQTQESERELLHVIMIVFRSEMTFVWWCSSFIPVNR
jgi:hypothetical protein